MLALAAQTNASIQQLAFIFSTRALGHVVGCVVGGWMLDKFRGGGHRLMVASLVLLSAGTALQPSASSVGVLAFLSALQGAGMGFLDPCCNVLLLWLHGSGSAPWMQAMHCCFGIGAFLSPLLVRAAQASSITASYHPSFYAMSAVLIVATVPFLLLPSPTAPTAPTPTAPTTHPSFSRRSCNCLQPLFTDTAVLVALTASILGVYVGAEVSYGAYVLVYAHEQLHVAEGDGQYITALFWGCLALGRLLAVFVTIRITPACMMWIVCFGCVVCAVVLLALPSVHILWVGSAALGAFMAPTFPTLYTLVGSYTTASGRVATVLVMGASAGVCDVLSCFSSGLRLSGIFVSLTVVQELLLPTLAGYLIDCSGPRSFTVLILGCALINLILFKLVLVYGQRVQQLVDIGGAEGELQSMIQKQELEEGA
jgi:FHS family Na+ dependent glucose MFS transporter 1